MFRLEMLPAGCGDCLWLEYGEPGNTHIVLIDGGEKATAARLTQRLRAALAARGQDSLFIDLLVITHYDNDHIEGVLEVLEKQEVPVTFGDIWFNGDQQLATLPPADAMGLGDLAATAEPGDEDLPPD
ncbi:MAG: MBL fold metallo-hydrolase, partial [Deltaproteobacteria bacterium]|nr:MBL fold metallo-hydrolase [Deltaproteobacteria bacterium]